MIKSIDFKNETETTCVFTANKLNEVIEAINLLTSKGSETFKEFTDFPKKIIHPSCECKKWKPRKNEKYWSIHSDGDILEYSWKKDSIDEKRLNLGNVFPTESEAIAARDAIRGLLKNI